LITSLLASANTWTGGQTFTADTNVNNVYFNPSANTFTALMQADATNLFVYAPSAGFIIRHTGISPVFASSFNVFQTGFELYKDNGNLFMSGTSASNTISINGLLNMSSNQINAVADPTLAQDVATKNYVDTYSDVFSAAGAASFTATAVTPHYITFGAAIEASGNVSYATNDTFTINTDGVYSINIDMNVVNISAPNGSYTLTLERNGSTTDFLTQRFTTAGDDLNMSLHTTLTLVNTDILKFIFAPSTSEHQLTTNFITITRI